MLVANPRKVSAICQNVRKSDSNDSELLARIARADEKLRYPVEHVSEGMQRDLRPGCCGVCGTCWQFQNRFILYQGPELIEPRTLSGSGAFF